MAKTPSSEQLARVAAKGKIGRGTRAQALELIFQTAIEEHEGFRHGVLGTPRYGKTFHLKEVVAESQSRGISDLALIHDCKRLDVQYDGNVRADAEDLAANPLKEDDDPTIVFHGDPANGKKCSVEAVASLGLRQGRQGTATIVLVDELYHGLKSRQTWEGPSFAEVLREGSSQRVSSAWTTQIPQALPTEALDCTETIALFRLKGRSLRYAIDKLDLPPEAQEIVRRLEKGEFILLTSIDDWDGIVYGPS